MKSFNLLFQSEELFIQFVKKHELNEYPNVLVSVFCGKVYETTIEKVANIIQTHIPRAAVIGCTTDGEIMGGTHTSEEIVISFTVFEKTEVKSFSIKDINKFNAKFLGEDIGMSHTTIDTKAIIILSSHDANESTLFIEGIQKVAPNTEVAGGLAGDNGHYKKQLVFDGKQIIENGIVGVVLDSQVLQAHTGYHSKWKEVGRPFLITKASGNIVYSIEQKKPLQILKQYLGQGFISRLPISSAEFPFVLKNSMEKRPIFIRKVEENGAIQLSEEVTEGDELTFAYADTETLIDHSTRGLKKLAKKSVESIFVFPCMSRRRFFSDFTNYELRILEQIAPSVGFFCYGEIVKKDQNLLIEGNAMTYLALSESKGSKEVPKHIIKFKGTNQVNTMMAFTQLMEASTEDLRQMHDNVQLSEQYYRSLFDHNSDVVYSTDLNGRFTSANPSFEEVFGYEKSEFLGKSALKFIQDKDIPRVRNHFYRTMRGKEQFYELEVVSKNGSTHMLHIKNIPIIVNGEMVGVYGIGRDITEKIRTEEKVTHLAHFDHETGLANRTLFSEMVVDQIKKAKKKKRSLAAMFIDMDRFKIINDSLGHTAGDYVLKELAYRIQNSLPRGSFMGRFGGDKFTVLISQDGTEKDYYDIAYRISENIKKPVIFDQQEFFISSSIGVSMYPTDGTDSDTLLRNSDAAMNRAKLMGGSRIVFFSSELNEKAIKRLEMERELRKALKRNEFHLVFQPIVDLKTNRITGSEALIRWVHPRYGTVAPGVFIPIAEETGIIKEIGEWVLKEACNQNANWHKQGYNDLTISVNVSAHQLLDPAFVLQVDRAIEESGLSPEFLYLELTESVMIGNLDYCLRVMNELQHMGINISIDDFGTGYSSLSYIKTLPANRLKIDKSFIDHLSRNAPDLAVVQAVIMMGNGLNMNVVAEGVETKEQASVLLDLQCEYVQGYYFSRPLQKEDFEKQLPTQFLTV
ncbi:hypothetical protein GCM10008967_01240 [Bacillus carboniphilus]|uniref:Diguanylate cyclase n=1 Tax=Bacillus carboniphilus TaxID=86663 RepID=A0ABN0VQ70_9BACI